MKKSLGAATLAEPTPLWCVGSYDEAGKPNVMAAAWGGICCSKPPCVTVSLQKIRHSYQSIMKRMAYTVSVPPAKLAKEADYFGIASGKDVDKFARTGLTPVRSELVDAPYVKEFPLIIECKVIHVYDIGLHTLFIGEILDVKADEEILDGKGKIDAAKLKPLIFSPGARVYHGIGENLGPAFQIGKDL
ncbi:MAG: flavin reductase family protein [Spirochaetales bacterium]|nr:flavin reductase family protein [Spirochaetales bacterium]